MDIIDFELEIVQIPVTISLPFNDFNPVVDAFHLCCRYAEDEIVEDPIGMSAKLSGKASKGSYPGTEGLSDPALKEPFSLISHWQFPEQS